MVATERSFELRLLVALLALIAVFTVWVIPASVEDPENFGYAEGLAPSFSVYLVAALAAVTLVGRLVLVLKTTPEQTLAESARQNSSDEQSDETADSKTRSWAIIGACLIFSFLLIPYIGFYISSFAFVLFLAIIMGERRAAVLTCLPILLIAAIYAGFELGFTIFLPRGELFLYLFDTLGY